MEHQNRRGELLTHSQSTVVILEEETPKAMLPHHKGYTTKLQVCSPSHPECIPR